MKNIFKIKNGRKFIYALKKAAKEPNVGKMFLDNLKSDVSDEIENGEFKLALLEAFIWEDSNEKSKFWGEVCNNIKDLK